MQLAIYIILAPLITSLINGVLYILDLKREASHAPRISKGLFTFFALLGSGLSFVIAMVVCYVFFANSLEPTLILIAPWLNIGGLIEGFHVNFNLYIDSLSILMIAFISFIAFLIHIYSVSYMGDDEGYGKFFAYLNLFISSMFVLVLADNLLFMFIGWEGVGLCSYLLISFYFKDGENVDAGNKAFIMNRVGDFCFIIGMLILFVSVGHLDYPGLKIAALDGAIPEYVAYIVALFLFLGACGKSAQIPLHTWLADAMAGPTPVSALIHAATMVTAGLYMISRLSFIYSITDFSEIIAYVGVITALLAALIATRQSDIKKILAYSTISQLGYMFVAAGLGNYAGSMFHVFTHAFFKALLFLGAGAIIFILHHEQNIFKMGQLSRVKCIYIPMLIATLAISGIPPFAGFFSKDAILLSAFSSQHYFIYGVGLFTALLTSYYMFRLFFIVFHGNDTGAHATPTPLIMKVILAILAIGSLLSALVGIPHALGGHDYIASFLALSTSHVDLGEVSLKTEYILMVVAIVTSLIGIGIAYARFYRPFTVKESHGFFATILDKRFYFDEFYAEYIVSPLNCISCFIRHGVDVFIKAVVDGYANTFVLLSYVYNGISQCALLRVYGIYMAAGISILALVLQGAL